MGGPFAKEPFEACKISGLLAIPKPDGRVRPVVNLSGPKGSSVNDGMDKNKLNAEWTVKMCTPAQFAQALLFEGKGSKMYNRAR